MTHLITKKEFDGGDVTYESTTHVFKSVLNILNITVYVEQRNDDGTDWKHFVTVKLFGKIVLEWQYRDTFQRDFYINGEVC